MAIQIKTLTQLKCMRRAGIVVAESLQLIKENIAVGVTTRELDAVAVDHLKKRGAKPSFLGYFGYPAVICASINHEIVHGIPNERPLEDGDVVSIDFGAIIEGWHGDSAFTVGVGNVDPADQKMMNTCEESMWRGIAAGSAGRHLTDISFAIEAYTNTQGNYGILREYGGHGIGSEMHMEPHILNYGNPGMGPELKPGMAFAVEPMITRGTHKTKVLSDEWTVVSADKSRGAHFEHTFAILPDGKVFVTTAFDGGKAKLASLGIEISTLLS